MFIGVITVQLLQDWVVKVPTLTLSFWTHFCKILSHSFCFHQVNDEFVSLPFLREPHIYIERQSNIILLNTNIGLKVRNYFSPLY